MSKSIAAAECRGMDISHKSEVSMDHPFSELKAHYLEAVEQGFPAFIRSIKESNPINATPYVVGLSEFLRSDLPPAKAGLLGNLGAALEMLPEIGLRAEIMLIGGSFLMRDASPRDLDCVLYYSRETEPKADLARWQADRRASGLDIRLVPIEMDPVMVLKMTLFFGVLYTFGREEQPQMRGLLLVDCSK